MQTGPLRAEGGDRRSGCRRRSALAPASSTPCRCQAHGGRVAGPGQPAGLGHDGAEARVGRDLDGIAGRARGRVPGEGGRRRLPGAAAGRRRERRRGRQPDGEVQRRAVLAVTAPAAPVTVIA